MSENIGSIVGYLSLDRSNWDNEIRAAMAKADELGRKSPNIKIGTNAPTAIAQLAAVAAAVKRLQDAQGAERLAQSKLADMQAAGTATAGKLAQAEEKVNKAHRATSAATIALAAAYDKNDQAVLKAAADTDSLAKSADKTTQSFKVGLIPALLAIAPAAVPIAGVAGGALAGLIPVAATLGLGIKGIANDMQSGALAGTKYGSDINSVTNEFSKLQSVAAGGLLAGIDKGLTDSHGLFAEVNRDVAVMSGQLGDVVAGAAPALLKILTDLDPLFVTFGHAVADGAQHLEHWAESSDGVQRFVAYAQAELPTVLHLGQQLVVLLAHLAEGAAPVGDTLLHVLTGIAEALNAIPISAITALAYSFSFLYPAIKIVALVNAGLTALGVTTVTSAQRAELAAAKYQASSLQIQAAAREEAAAVARAEVEKADAAVASARTRQALVAETSGALAAEATAAEADAARYAEAMRSEAAAAERSSMQIRAAATEAAAASTAQADAIAASSRAGRARGGAMLGLAGVAAIAYVAGKALADYTEKGNAFAQVMDHAGNVQDSFNEALLESKGAIDANVTATVQAQIQQAGLAAKAARAGITIEQLTTGVTGNTKAFAELVQQWEASGKPSGDTIVALGMLHEKFGSAQDAAQHYAGQQRSTTTTVNAAATAAAALYGLTGSKGVSAYLAASQAAAQNAQQTKQQTLQFQLANDAASLLAQTLDKLAGKNLGYAQAQNSFDSALSNMGTHVSATGKQITFTTSSIRNMSSASVELRGQLLGQVTSAEQAAEAYGKLKGSSEAGRQKLIELRREIINNAVAHGVDRQAVTDYINTVLKIPQHVPPTKLQLDTRAARSAWTAFLGTLHDVTVTANLVANLQGTTRSQVPGHAAGGTVGGTGNSDSQLILATPGEEIINKRQSEKHRGLLKAINAGVDGFATGGSVGGISTTTAGGKTSYVYGGIQYASLSAAENAQTRAAQSVTKAMNALGHELPKFLASLNQSTAQLHSAEQTLIKDLQNAHATHAQLAMVHADLVQMNAVARERDQINAKLGTAPSAPTAYDKLATARSAYNQTASSVSQAFMSGFNITSAGAVDPNASWVQARLALGMPIPTQSGSSILSALQGTIATDQKYEKGLQKLGKEHLSKSLLAQLAQAGPEQGGATVAALLGASQSQINTLTLKYGQLQKLSNAAGKQTADVVNGEQLKAAQATVVELKKQLAELKKLRMELGRKVDNVAGGVAGALTHAGKDGTTRARGKGYSR